MTRLIRLVLLLALPAASAAVVAAPPPLRSAPVSVQSVAGSVAYDGTVEAVRQTVVAAQVAGAVIALDVKVGDRVKPARLDARTAEQSAAASDAQVAAARAALEVATRDLERQRKLADQRFISQAAFDRAEAEFKSTQAQLNAQIAQAGAARTQTGLFVVKAAYAGVVAEVPVALGDMAMPGKPLVTLYDPAQLRIAVPVPQGSAAARGTPPSAPRIEIPGPGEAPRWLNPVRVQALPTADPATHTVTVRLDLPAGTEGLAPGQFARVWFAGADAGPASGARPITVPASAIVRRADLHAVYVIDAQGKALLRQVRLGRTIDGRVEVLAGLSDNERVALDPQIAAQQR
jgi:RND family efflux transporter MFP subunit